MRTQHARTHARVRLNIYIPLKLAKLKLVSGVQVILRQR